MVFDGEEEMVYWHGVATQLGGGKRSEQKKKRVSDVNVNLVVRDFHDFTDDLLN